MTREKQIELMKNAPARLDAIVKRNLEFRKENDPGFTAQDLIEAARKAREGHGG